MWLYFNNKGQLTTILEHGSPARAGTTNFSIFAVFQGINTEEKLREYSATIRLRKPDLTGSEYPLLLMQLASNEFEVLTDEGETATNVSPFQNGTTYYGFLFDFGNFNTTEETEVLLDTDGLWEAVITLINNSGFNVQGTATFEVGGTGTETPTEISYSIITNQLVEEINKRALKSSVIITTSNLSSLDLTLYEEGQLFFNELDKNIYIFSDNDLVLFANFSASIVDNALSTTSIHPVENRVITNEINKCRIITDLASTQITLKEFYDTYGLGLYILLIGQNYYVFNFKAYSESGNNATITATLYPLYNNTKQYVATDKVVLISSIMVGMTGWLDSLGNIVINNFSSSDTIARLSPAFGYVIFTINSGKDLYIGHYDNSSPTVCEIESLSSSKRWYATGLPFITPLSAFMSNTYRNDYALESALSEVYKPQGSATVSTLNGLTKTESMNSYVYNMSDAGNLTNEDTSTLAVLAGDNVVFIWNGGSWYWSILSATVDLSNYSTLTGDNTFSGNNTFAENVAIPETPTVDAHATSKKYVDTGLSAKQDTLIGTQTTGQNIKTINGSSILGTGDLQVSVSQSGLFRHEIPLESGLDFDTLTLSFITNSSAQITDYSELNAALNNKKTMDKFITIFHAQITPQRFTRNFYPILSVVSGTGLYPLTLKYLDENGTVQTLNITVSVNDTVTTI